MKPREIIDRLNDLLREQAQIGETVIDCVIDAREDDGLPPFTAEELAAAEAECDANIEADNAIEDEIERLQIKYCAYTGKRAIYVDSFVPYFRAPFPWEG